MAELSTDILLFNILPRLPVKSLRRFQCVSKQWLSFISTPELAKMQLHHVTTNQLQDDDKHHKLLVISSADTNYFRIIDYENAKQNSLTASSRPLPFKVRYENSIVTSFHGMVCVGIIEKRSWKYFYLILWNPSTGEYKTLSKPYFNEECCLSYRGQFGLYYSSSDDDYKLLRITCYPHPHVYIYSLKSDSWRKNQLTETFPSGQQSFSYDRKAGTAGVFLNEKLYFLEQFNRGNYSVIRFDTKTEKLTQIATPFSQNTNTMLDCLSFMVLRGCIHLLATFFLPENERYDELWRMDEDEDGRWTKVETILGFSSTEKPLHLRRNGKWLVQSNTCGNIYQVNLKKKKKKNKHRLCLLKGSDILIIERYMTLVSPNQYMMKEHIY